MSAASRWASASYACSSVVCCSASHWAAQAWSRCALIGVGGGLAVGADGLVGGVGGVLGLGAGLFGLVDLPVGGGDALVGLGRQRVALGGHLRRIGQRGQRVQRASHHPRQGVVMAGELGAELAAHPAELGERRPQRTRLDRFLAVGGRVGVLAGAKRRRGVVIGAVAGARGRPHRVACITPAMQTRHHSNYGEGELVDLRGARGPTRPALPLAPHQAGLRDDHAPEGRRRRRGAETVRP